MKDYRLAVLVALGLALPTAGYANDVQSSTQTVKAKAVKTGRKVKRKAGRAAEKTGEKIHKAGEKLEKKGDKVEAEATR
jgi:hypothetical protein